MGMRALRVTAAAAVLCVLAAGCGAKSLPLHPGAHRPMPPARLDSGGRATVAGNLAASRAEAARLLALARVPRGAEPLARPPRSLAGPALGQPGVSSLVDRVMTWRVRLPFPAAQSWLSAHPPRGLPGDGSAQSSDQGVPGLAGYSYRGPASPAWQSAELEIGTAPAGRGASVIRADAVIVWLDPRPVRSGPGRYPIRVTVSSGCPPTDAGVSGVANPGGGLSERLLPLGQPSAGLRCRYDGLNGHPWHLVNAQRLTVSAARQVARSMARLPLAHPDGGVTMCPMDDESAEVLVLAYPGRPDVDLWVKLNGCGGVFNGHIATGGV
jgi:hypothetical protein